MRGRLLAAVLVLSLAMAPPLSQLNGADAQDQNDTRDRAQAAAAAQQIFALAAQGNYSAMYDLIHPDAHAVVPRAAAVGTFQAVYTAVKAGQSQVVGVQLVAWTWPVTGQAYPRAAAVEFAQPYTDSDGQDAWLSDTMYLVQDAQGQWRWFFGSSAAFVQNAIAQYGGTQVQETIAQSITEGNLIQNVVNDLDAFWADTVHYTQFTYSSPGVVVVNQGESAQTGCGPAQGNFAGFYCPPDVTIYLDVPFLQNLEQQAPFAAAFVIAHEWAHHIQSGVSFVRVGPGEAPSEWNEVYSIELETMADCMAGVWARDAQTRGLLDEHAIDQAIQLAIQMLGDPNGVGELDPQAHGSGEERAAAIKGGYENGFLACNLKI